MTGRELDELRQAVTDYLEVKLPVMVAELTRANLDAIIESKLDALLDRKLGRWMRTMGYTAASTIVAATIAWCALTAKVDSIDANGGAALKAHLQDVRTDRDLLIRIAEKLGVEAQR